MIKSRAPAGSLWMAIPPEPLSERVRRLLGTFASDLGFSIADAGDPTDSFGAWVRLESREFVVCVIRDRDQEWTTVGTKVRPKPRAPLRWWPLSHVVAYLDGARDPYPLCNLETEAEWLIERATQLLDSTLINSEGLRQWAVRSSRARFGRRPGK
jgi:hypothetical protein